MLLVFDLVYAIGYMIELLVYLLELKRRKLILIKFKVF